MTRHADPQKIPAREVDAGDMVHGPDGWHTVIAPTWRGGPDGDVVLHCVDEDGEKCAGVLRPDEPVDTRKLIHDPQLAT